MQMTSYLHHKLILMKETYPESLVKIQQDDVILRHLTSFSYIFPYYDVIDKNADVSENNDVIANRNRIPLCYFIIVPSFVLLA